MSRNRDLPLHALRTFVATVDCGGFTSAAKNLGLTQPTVSQQIKKLEEQIGEPLIDRRSRTLTLTGCGLGLLDYARRIVDLNDEAMTTVTLPRVTGTLKLGLPHEFTLTLLPRLVGSFNQIHPGVVVEVDCQLSKDLLSHAGDYDLIIALHEKRDRGGGVLLRKEPLTWVASHDYRVDPTAPLLVAAAPMPCIYRQVLQRTLKKHRPGWSIYLSSVSYGAICGAVSAGAGVALLAGSVAPENLRQLELPGLPALPTLELRMHGTAATDTPTVATFASFVQDRVAEA